MKIKKRTKFRFCFMMTSPQLSGEERDQLERSNKKIKGLDGKAERPEAEGF